MTKPRTVSDAAIADAKLKAAALIETEPDNPQPHFAQAARDLMATLIIYDETTARKPKRKRRGPKTGLAPVMAPKPPVDKIS